MELEYWLPCPGYEDYYLISNLGRLKSLIKKEEKILKNNLKESGYFETPPLHPDRKTHRLHRLVALAFIPNPDNKPEIDHINRDKSDNRVINLRWATRLENQNNTLRKPGRSGEPFITIRYLVRVRKTGHNFQKECSSLEEALEVRNEYLQKNNIPLLE